MLLLTITRAVLFFHCIKYIPYFLYLILEYSVAKSINKTLYCYNLYTLYTSPCTQSRQDSENARYQQEERALLGELETETAKQGSRDQRVFYLVYVLLVLVYLAVYSGYNPLVGGWYALYRWIMRNLR